MTGLVKSAMCLGIQERAEGSLREHPTITEDDRASHDTF
jgi:hypothetical protein